MPSRVSNTTYGTTPVVKEVRPRNAAPSTPSPPPSPKAVRFEPSSKQRVSRPLTNTEEWSLWHFENHASQCRACHDPFRSYKEGKQLCSEGHALAQDVACNVVWRFDEEDVYAARKESNKLVRVEVKPGYRHVMGLLKSMDHHLRGGHVPEPGSSRRQHPVLSYDRNYPVSARYPREYHTDRRGERRETVIVEPHSTSSSKRPERRPSHHASKSSRHPSKRYEKVVLEDDVEASAVQPVAPKYKERRGSLYDAEMAKMEREREKKYRVEVREPESTSSRRRRDREERRRWE